MAQGARGRLQMQHMRRWCCSMAASQLMHVECVAGSGQPWKLSGTRARLICPGAPGLGSRSVKVSKHAGQLSAEPSGSEPRSDPKTLETLHPSGWGPSPSWSTAPTHEGLV